MFGVAKSEHPRLTNGEIIFEELQPMWSQFTNVTDRQTDDMRSQYRALHLTASRGNKNVNNVVLICFINVLLVSDILIFIIHSAV